MTNERTVSVSLTAREITLIRCGLLKRCDTLKERADLRDSYEQSLDLLNRLFAARKTIER